VEGVVRGACDGSCPESTIVDNCDTGRAVVISGYVD